MPSPGGWGVRIRELAFLRVHTDEGPSGLAELFSVPAGVAKAVLDGPDSYLGRHLVGQDPIPPERVWRALHDTVLHSNRRGWQMICIGAVDIALWDLFGKVLGRPVYQLLGGSAHAPHQTVTGSELGAIVPYATIILSEWDRETVLAEQIEHVEALLDSGYRAVKIEPLRSTSATILELTRRAREALGPGPHAVRGRGLPVERRGRGEGGCSTPRAPRCVLPGDSVSTRIARSVCPFIGGVAGSHRGRGAFGVALGVPRSDGTGRRARSCSRT